MSWNKKQQHGGNHCIFFKFPHRKLPKSPKVQSSELQQLLKGCEDSSLRLRQGLLEVALRRVAPNLPKCSKFWILGAWSNLVEIPRYLQILTNPFHFCLLYVVILNQWLFFITVLFVQAAEGSPNAKVLLTALGNDQPRPWAVKLYNRIHRQCQRTYTTTTNSHTHTHIYIYM